MKWLILEWLVYFIVFVAVMSLCNILTSCAEFSGNGVTLGVQWEDPDNNVKVDLRTAK